MANADRTGERVASTWLSELLRHSREQILQRWMALFLERFPARAALSDEDLRDSLPALIDDVADTAARAAPNGRVTPISDVNAASHATARFGQGFALEEIAGEYSLLRKVILTLVVEQGERLGPGELVLLNESVDMAVALAIDVYVNASRSELTSKSRLLEGVLQQMPVGVIVADAASERIAVANEQASRLLGSSQGGVGLPIPNGKLRIARRDGNLLDSRDWPARRSLEHGEAVTGEELEIDREDGSRSSVRVSSAPVRDADGRVQAIVCLVEDVTAARAAELEREALVREIERRDRLSQAVLDQIPVGILLTDPQSHVVMANPQVERILRHPFRSAAALEDFGARYAGFDLTGRRYPSEHWPLARSLRTGEVVRGEIMQVERADGTRATLRISSAPVRETSGEVLAGAIVIEDITEQRQAEIERDRLWSFSRDLLSVLGMDAFLKRVNPAFTRTLGWSEEELLSSPFLEFVHPDDRSRTLSELRRLSEGMPTLRDDSRWLKKDGTYCWLSWSCTPVVEEGVVYAVARDITGQKHTEDAYALLAYAGAALTGSLDYVSTIRNVARMAVPALADACFLDLVDEEGRLRRVEVVHSDPRKSDLSRRLSEIDVDNPHSPVLRALRTGRMATLSTINEEVLERIAVSDDHAAAFRELAPRSWISVPLTARGERLGVLTLIYAESGRRHRPDDFVLAEDLSRRAAQAIVNARLFRESQQHVEFEKRLLAIVSHDLRNPLNAIQLNAEQLLERTTEADARARATRIRSASHRATRLVEDLLDLARIHLGTGIPLRPAGVDLRDVVRATLEEVHATRGGRRVVVEDRGDLQGTWDEDRLGQLLMNLVVNALKYSPSESEVLVRLEDEGDQVELAVKNAGKPIPSDRLERIFEPLQRADRGGAGRESLGLGLYIAREIVAAHGGTIDVRSTEEEGTTFTIRLPRFAATQRDSFGRHDASESLH